MSPPALRLDDGAEIGKSVLQAVDPLLCVHVVTMAASGCPVNGVDASQV
jgi:hypothetical protein